jgi:hypothetical protein
MLISLGVGAHLNAGVYQQQLRHECDELMASAVKRPYGWGWDTTAPQVAGRSTPRHVSMEPLGTPAAGLLLLWAGQFLDEPRYKDAAHQAARGVAASQASSGQIPLHAIFAGSAGGRDPTAIVPDRTATRAAMALLLAVVRDDRSRSEPLTRATQRATFWLMKQAADDGGWPSAYVPDPEQRRTLRIIRLDTIDYRDCTFAMLLAADVLDDRQVSDLAQKSVQKLLSLRMTGRLDEVPEEHAALAPHLSQLWSTAYRLDGSIDERLGAFPAGADMVASRLAMQTLLGAYLMLVDKQVGLAMDSAMQALAQLRDPAGQWRRAYITAPTTAPATAPASQPSTDPSNPFAPVAAAGPWTTGTYDLEPTLDAIGQLKLMGRDKYVNMLQANFTVRQHLAACVVGLADTPATLQLPVTKSEAAEYLKRRPDAFADLSTPPPQDLAARNKRLWLLLIRSRIERMMEKE